MFFVKERPPLIKQKYCRKEDPRLSVTSSYHLNQSTLRGNTGYTCEKNGYSFVNAHRLQNNLRRICQLIAVSCKIAATSQIRELESLCIRQRAILNWPSGNRSFALTAPTSTSTGFSRSTQFISHPTALSGPFIKKEHRDD